MLRYEIVNFGVILQFFQTSIFTGFFDQELLLLSGFGVLYVLYHLLFLSTESQTVSRNAQSGSLEVWAVKSNKRQKPRRYVAIS